MKNKSENLGHMYKIPIERTATDGTRKKSIVVTCYSLQVRTFGILGTLSQCIRHN